MAIEIVDLPINSNDDLNDSCVSLPKGKSEYNWL